MIFAIICMDKPDHGHVRTDNRPLHLQYLEANTDRVVFAGPLLSDDGDGMIGSLLVMDFDHRAAAADFAANDPYARAGLFETVTIVRWKKVIPAD